MAGKHALHNASSADYWLECGYWYQHKIQAEARGEDYNPDSDASIRGNQMHDVAEKAMHSLLAEESWSLSQVESAVFAALEELELDDVLTAADAEQVTTALVAVLELADTLDCDSETGLAFGLELQVPLSHEPGSHGTIDVAIFGDDFIAVLDYKFGAQPVESDASQFWVYASNLIRNRKPVSRIILGVVQPQIREEVLTHETTWEALVEFRGHVNHTVRRQLSGDVYAPPSIQTCNAYCPFKDRCAGYVQLLTTAGRTLVNTSANEQIEWLVVNKSAIEDGLDILAGLVKEQVERFPNWSRKEVNNARKWNPAADMGEIAHQLRIRGKVEEPYTLKTPAEILDEYPDAAPVVNQFTLERGTHVRLMRPTTAPPLSATILTRDIAEVLAQREAAKAAKAEAKKQVAEEKAAAKLAAAQTRADGRPKAARKKN